MQAKQSKRGGGGRDESVRWWWANLGYRRQSCDGAEVQTTVEDHASRPATRRSNKKIGST
jgi:hypothetical protein